MDVFLPGQVASLYRCFLFRFAETDLSVEKGYREKNQEDSYGKYKALLWQLARHTLAR